MTQATQETLSALLDGECSPAEMQRLLDELEHSPELKQQWSRLCLAREVRAGTRVRKAQPSICAGVMAALDAEPAHANVVPLVTRRRFDFKSLPGLAAAAAIGAMAVLVALPTVRDVRNDATASVPSPEFLPQIITPVALPVERRSRRGLQTAALDPEEAQQREELNNLLAEHNGSVAGQGMGGTLRYARFAAHTADYQPAQDVSEGAR